NQEYEFYDPLSLIFGSGDAVAQDGSDKVVLTPTKKIDPETAELSSLGNVELVVYTGQFTRDESSGIDMLIVGDLNQAKLQKFMKDLEEKEKKEIRYVIMNPEE